MSQTDVGLFLAQAATDETLRAAVHAAVVTEHGRMTLSVERLVALGREYGFEFTEEELQQHILDDGGTEADGELDDAQLEVVAGGTVTTAGVGRRLIQYPAADRLGFEQQIFFRTR